MRMVQPKTTAASTTATTNLLHQMKMTMGPSSSSMGKPQRTAKSVLFSSSSSSSDFGSASSTSSDSSLVSDERASFAAVAHPDEPNLYLMPSQLRPVYGNVPLLGQVLISSSAFVISAATTWRLRNLTWIAPIIALNSGEWSLRKVATFLLKVRLLIFNCRKVFLSFFLNFGV